MQPASFAFLILTAGFALASALPVNAQPPACVPVGVFVDPASNERRDDAPAALAKRKVVLLGESHDQEEHHRWQLHTLAALLGQRPDLVLGFEMFPRRVQPVLDRWVNGELSEADFLRDVDWAEVWGYDAELYLPLFHFARMHRLPMLALNIDRATSRRIVQRGLSGVPIDEREGVGDPAPASQAYRDRLFEVFKQHPAGRTGAGPESGMFQRFVEAQLLWDRAMAEAIASARRDKDPLIVGIMGQGHMEYRDGVVHQLAALGIEDVATALPWPVDAECRRPDPKIADLVFGVAPPKEVRAPRQRLGVVVAVADGGVRIEQIFRNSIAATAGLQVDDLIETAAGVALRMPADLVTIVRRQAPGTWLPLAVRRGEQSLEVVARFPAER
jgi:uncharacterized iron-regulated protein